MDVRPEIANVRSFYRVVFRRAVSAKRLAVIDEFPLLLGTSPAADSSLAAAMEEETGSSRLKLVLCGSQIATMETLLAERAPLHGRGSPMLMRPLRFEEAIEFLRGLPPAAVVTRYGIAGGMPLYLRRIGRKGSLRTILCEDVLSPLGPLFDEVREVLTMELTSTATHFSLLGALSAAPSLAWDELVARSRVEEPVASRYIRVLEDLHIVQAANPLFAPRNARRRRYRIADPLVRFWFRFVFPYQADLAAGLKPEDHYDRNVAPFLPEHVAPVLEDVAGEFRWQGRAMGREVLDDLVQYKLPALAQAGVDVSRTAIALFSRGGFRKSLVEEAARRGDVELVDLNRLIQDFEPSSSQAPSG